MFFKSDKSVTEFRERQLADPDLQVIIQAPEGNFDDDPNDLSHRQRLFLSRLQEFQLKLSVLVRVIDRTGHAVFQIVVAHSMKQEILRLFHDDPRRRPPFERQDAWRNSLTLLLVKLRCRRQTPL